jgi:hypothetical protein
MHAAHASCRHPASGYVQGINDLVTPFLAVFLSSHCPGPVEAWGEVELPEEVPFLAVKAHSMSPLLQPFASPAWCDRTLMRTPGRATVTH